jgi:hypothetical protein
MVSYANVPPSDLLQAFMRTVREVARELTRSGAWPGRCLVPDEAGKPAQGRV